MSLDCRVRRLVLTPVISVGIGLEFSWTNCVALFGDSSPCAFSICAEKNL